MELFTPIGFCRRSGSCTAQNMENNNLLPPGGDSSPSPFVGGTNPRALSLLKALIFYLQCRIQLFQSSFATMLLSLLLGFLLANIFGTFLGALRCATIWDGFVIFGLVVLVEVISCARYQTLQPPPVGVISFAPTKNQNLFWRLTNNFKVGLLLGFFVEAFKVGS